MRRLLLLIALLSFAPLALAANSAVLTWTAPTTRTDGTTIAGTLSYNVYQGAKGAEVKSQTALSALTVTVATGLAGGSTVCWYVTAVETGGLESAPSNEGCKTFPLAPPNASTLIVL